MPEFRGQQGATSHEPPPVKLLFDQNLSHWLPSMVADVYPGAGHVRDFGMERADDDDVWDFAGNGGFTITSKDSDFHHLS
jgi:predicted nuclease of predicted toxin-antitoxin system